MRQGQLVGNAGLAAELGLIEPAASYRIIRRPNRTEFDRIFDKEQHEK
jgi:hypothetical protein